MKSQMKAYGATAKVKAERLDYLLDYLTELNEIEPERFDLSTWMSAARIGGSVKEARATWRTRYEAGEPLNCGTSACVAGHLLVAFGDDWGWRHGNPVYLKYYTKSKEASDYRMCDPAHSMAAFFGGEYFEWKSIIYENRYTEYPVKLTTVIGRIEGLFKKLYG